MMKIDKKNRKIISCLLDNARISKTQISKLCNIPKEVVRYRINNLEKKNIIKTYIPIIDLSILGYSIYRLQIKFNSTENKIKNEFFNYIKLIPQISWIVNLSGNWDIVLLFNIKENKEFSLIYDEIMNKYGNIIKDKLFTIVTKINYLKPIYITQEEKRKEIIIGNKKQNFQLEKNSNLILNELMKNARTSLVEIATKLNLSITTIKYHIKQLENVKIILGYRTIINISKLGYERFKVTLELTNPSEKNKVKNILKTNPNVIYITDSLGKYDLEFEVEYEKSQYLINFIEKIKKETNLNNFDIIYNNEEILINDIPK